MKYKDMRELGWTNHLFNPFDCCDSSSIAATMGCNTLVGTVYCTDCSVASSCPSVMRTFNSLLVSGDVVGADTYLESVVRSVITRLGLKLSSGYLASLECVDMSEG